MKNPPIMRDKDKMAEQTKSYSLIEFQNLE